MDALHGLGGVVQSAQLGVCHPRRGQHLVGRIGCEACAPFVHAQTAPVNEFQEAQLQLVWLQGKGVVKALPEGGEVLLRQARNEVDVQVDIAGDQDAADAVRQLVHVGVAVAGVQGGPVEGLQAGLHLEQACRSRRQEGQGFVVEKVGGNLEVIAHLADVAARLRIDQPPQELHRPGLVAVEGAVDEFDRVAAGIADANQQCKGLVHRHKLNRAGIGSLLISGEAEGALERAPARGLHIGHATVERGVPGLVVEVAAGGGGRGGDGRVQAVRRGEAAAGDIRRVAALCDDPQQSWQTFLACAAQQVVNGHLPEGLVHREGRLRATDDNDHLRP